MRQIEAVVIAALLSWEKTTHTEEVAVIAVTEVNYTGKNKSISSSNSSCSSKLENTSIINCASSCRSKLRHIVYKQGFFF